MDLGEFTLKIAPVWQRLNCLHRGLITTFKYIVLFLFEFSEKAVLAVTLSNDNEDVLGHAAFLDYPNVPGVDQAHWEEWLNDFYDCKGSNALNSVFMHYFVSRPEYSHGCSREIIRTMFNAVPELHYCFLVVPVGVYPGNFN